MVSPKFLHQILSLAVIVFMLVTAIIIAYAIGYTLYIGDNVATFILTGVLALACSMIAFVIKRL